MKPIDCKEVRKKMLLEATTQLTHIYETTGQTPKLVIFQPLEDNASDVYVRNKIKTCEDLGVLWELWQISNQDVVEDIRACIQKKVEDPYVTGIILQLPLPEHLKPYEEELLNLIPWQKDVDGLTDENVMRLWTGKEGIRPATAEAVCRLLPEDLSGKQVQILGRSKLVGMPLLRMLLDRNATVDICHSHTTIWDRQCGMKYSDYVISAVGKPRFIEAVARPHSHTFIDVGISRDEDGRLCGDFDISERLKAQDDEDRYTPVPGGVGILTTAQVVLNLLRCWEFQEKEETKEDN